MVVSKVQISSPLNRTRPKPRATSVSKVIQAVVTPSASVASSPSATFQSLGRVSARVAVSMSRTWPWPSIVLRFQVKVTRSRQ